MSDALKLEDYEEPVCLLNMDQSRITPVPQGRIREKLDEYMSTRDYAGAERHLLYWLREAQYGHDERGELMVRNEMVGHYRKVNNREKGLEQTEAVLRMVKESGFENTVTAGTSYINCATALNAFGENERSLELFRKAETVYEGMKQVDPALFGGLYNNMALACTALGKYAEAHELYAKATEQMKKVRCGELERAITCLNDANVWEAELGMEAAEGKIYDLLDEAEELLDTEGIPYDGYYAFVCEKCEPTFRYYGYFLYAEKLKKRAEEIYGRD